MQLIDPLKPFKICWNILISLLIIYSAILIPFCLAFSIPMTGWIFWVNLSIDIFLFLDIGLSFFTKSHKSGFHPSSLKMNSRKYLKGWFTIDVIATFPWDDILPLFFPILLPYKSVLALTRLLRLIKIYRFLTILNRIPHLNPTIVRIIRLLISVTVYAHWIACIWLYISVFELHTATPKDTWAVRYEISEQDTFAQYVRSLYWVITTMTTVGYGDITPNNTIETIFTMVVMILGVSIYAYIIGNIASMIANLDAYNKRFQNQLLSLSNFMKVHRLPRELKERIHDYMQLLWSNRKQLVDNTATDFLPKCLRQELALHITREVVQKVPMFSDCGIGVMNSISMMLTSESYLAGDVILREGEIANEMYFIALGQVKVMDDTSGEVLATIGKGGFFGEVALIKDNTTRTRTIKAADRVECFILAKKDFEILLNCYPEFKDKIHQIVQERDTHNKSSKKETDT